MSFTYTENTTFTVTHARHMAAKVAADLKRMQRFYGKPNDTSIAEYEAEVVTFLKHGYLGEVTYGFKRDGLWVVPTLRYTASELNGSAVTDDDPGKVRPGANIDDASFYSYLIYSASWHYLTADEKEKFATLLPFSRTSADAPGLNGYLESDRRYSAGGWSLSRSSLRAP